MGLTPLLLSSPNQKMPDYQEGKQVDDEDYDDDVVVDDDDDGTVVDDDIVTQKN